MDEFTVEPAKTYTTPVRVMIIIALVIIFLSFTNARYIAYLNAGQRGWAYFFLFLWPVLIVAETIVYWFLRKKIKSDVNVWMHLGANFTAFVLLNVIFTIINLNIDAFSVPFIIAANKVHYVIFWLAVIVGRAFFVAIIVKSFRKEPVEDDSDQPGGILDGIMDDE